MSCPRIARTNGIPLRAARGQLCRRHLLHARGGQSIGPAREACVFGLEVVSAFSQDVHKIGAADRAAAEPEKDKCF